jgi:GT2 family glycosyltransferase
MRPPGSGRLGRISKTEVAVALAAADRARDAGHWKEAAAQYAAAIDSGHSDPAIRIQLGNMLKEAGELLNAEAAYRLAIAEQPGSSDGWLQLGHVLKLLGRRDAAAKAYQRSLDCDAMQAHAAAELLSLGAGWRITEVNAGGRSLIYDTIAAVQDLRRSLALLEARLPAIESLASLPLHRFDLYTARYQPRLPASMTRARLDLLILPDAEAPVRAVGLLGALKRLLAAAPGVVRHIAVVAAEDWLRDFAAQHLSPLLPVLGAPPSTWLPKGALTDWVLVAENATRICDTALAWFSYAAAQVGPDCLALICDEVLREAPDAVPQPILLPGFDARAIAAINYQPSLFAVRRALLGEVSVAKAETLLAAAAARGRVVHVPRLLTERSRLPPLPAVTPRLRAPACHIRIIIPTREAGALLDRCIGAAQAQAARSDLLRYTIIDNRPGDITPPIKAPNGASVVRRAEPFNWAAFNNLAAEAATEELLFFLNDDVQLLTPGWDVSLIDAFTDPRVAAAGLRLLYPDGRVQHAGIVLGQNRRTEHEARGSDRSAPGPLFRWVTRRRAAAVTGAAMACRSSVFRDCGGFDSVELPVWFNDVDLCLKLRAAGHEVLFLGDIEAVHLESHSLRSTFDEDLRSAAWTQAYNVMRERWGLALTADPTYNPHFSRIGEPFENITDPSEAQVIGWIHSQG